jgi:hypothetical protein
MENMESLFKDWKEQPEKLISDRVKKFRAMGQNSLAHAPIHSGT